MPHIQVEAIL